MAAAAAKAAGGADRKALRDTVAKLKLDTIVGPLDWTKGPVRNVAKTPLVGGQWRRGGGPFKYELVITENKAAPEHVALPAIRVIGHLAQRQEEVLRRLRGGSREGWTVARLTRLELQGLVRATAAGYVTTRAGPVA